MISAALSTISPVMRPVISEPPRLSADPVIHIRGAERREIKNEVSCPDPACTSKKRPRETLSGLTGCQSKFPLTALPACTPTKRTIANLRLRPKQMRLGDVSGGIPCVSMLTLTLTGTLVGSRMLNGSRMLEGPRAISRGSSSLNNFQTQASGRAHLFRTSGSWSDIVGSQTEYGFLGTVNLPASCQLVAITTVGPIRTCTLYLAAAQKAHHQCTNLPRAHAPSCVHSGRQSSQLRQAPNARSQCLLLAFSRRRKE